MRRKTTLRRAAAALVLPIALTGVAACGSDEPSGSDKAADPGVEAGEQLEAGEFVDMLSESFENGETAHATMENDGQLGMKAEGDVDYSSDPPSSEITMSMEMLGDEELSAIMVDGVMYMQMGEMSGGKYIKMDLNDSENNMLGQDFTSQLDPSAALKTMEGAIKTVTYVGEEDVDGEELTHYTVVIDSAKMVGDAMGGDLAAQSGLPEEIDYDVWFDDEGRFSRTVMDMGETAGTMTMELSDWGKEVDIEAPPADQVTEMPKVPSMPSSPSEG